MKKILIKWFGKEWYCRNFHSAIFKNNMWYCGKCDLSYERRKHDDDLGAP